MPGGSALRFARLGAVAWDFLGTIGAGAVVGWLADRWLSTEPWLLTAGTVLGSVGGFIRLIETLRRFERIDGDARD